MSVNYECELSIMNGKIIGAESNDRGFGVISYSCGQNVSNPSQTTLKSLSNGPRARFLKLRPYTFIINLWDALRGAQSSSLIGRT